MIELKKHYENTKRNANFFMKKGQLNAYVNALLEMNRYKKLISAVAAN